MCKLVPTVSPSFGRSFKREKRKCLASLAKGSPTKQTFHNEISVQIKLIKKGDVGRLKGHFTKRQQTKINKKMLGKAVAEVSKYPIDELVHAIEIGEYKGAQTVKVKMKNGRSLTTFFRIKGQWQADTLWFK